MSSAENGRLVWLTEEQRDRLTGCARPGREVVAAWDEAPADPAEAVLDALNQPHGFDNEPGYVILERQVQAVLGALGVPQRPTPRDETPHG